MHRFHGGIRFGKLMNRDVYSGSAEHSKKIIVEVEARKVI